MDIERSNDHEARTEEVRLFLAHGLRKLIDTIEAGLEYDPSAGMTTALIAAYRELGRLYQVAEKPGGKGLSEIQVARMLEQARTEGRLEALEAMTATRQAALESATASAKASLEALSSKSLG